MKHEKRSACRFDLSVRQIGQIGQATIRLIEKYLSLYKHKALSAVENAMKCRGEQ
jgi:hypothetical protein